MAETPNIGLYVIDLSNTDVSVMEWVQKMSSSSSASNMMMLDAVLYALQTQKANKVVESESEPSDSVEFDEWDQVLGEGAVPEWSQLSNGDEVSY